jgi:signal transduction histidine kinase
MRSLAFRIFLWLWLAMAALGVALVVSSPWFTRTRPRLEHWQQVSEATLLGWSAEVARMVELHGVTGLDAMPRRRRRDALLRVFVIDQQGREARGRAVPEEARDLAERVFATGSEQVERAGTLHIAARPATSPDGRRWVVAAVLRGPPRLIDLLEPRALLPRLALLMLLVGLLSLGLASYLARPLASVRAAAGRLAAGDLSARIGPPVAGRRDEIGQLARDFDAMAERLEALVAAQRRLVQDVSHELRSPLARLAVAAELARAQAAPAAAETLDRIDREVARLDELVGQLLDLSRLEAGGETERAPLNLAEVIREVCADAELEAAARPCEIALDAPPTVTVEGSGRLLRSAVENVVRNAVRFTGPGTAVDVSLALEGTATARRAVVRVADRGPGVPADKLAHLFEPFFRVEEARERGAGGAGLGLAIAARAASLHGGTITATNRADGGLLLEMSLPTPA